VNLETFKHSIVLHRSVWCPHCTWVRLQARRYNSSVSPQVCCTGIYGGENVSEGLPNAMPRHG